MAPLRKVLFTPKPAPAAQTPELIAITQYVEQQFRELAKAVSSHMILQMDVQNVQPDKPRTGMFAFADGTNWNPGSGAGLYYYTGAMWVKFSDWNQLFKTADETTNTDTAFSDDAILKFAVDASGKYAFEFDVFYDTPTAADFKWQVNGPASPTLIIYDGFALAPGATSLTITRDNAFASSHALTETAGTVGKVKVEGFLHNGANAGTVALQWAQNTSNGSNTTVRAGSSIRWRKVA